MSRFKREWERLYARWRADIGLFVREGMRFEPTWQQDQLFDLIQLESMLPLEERKKRIADRSGQGPGKTSASTLGVAWRVLAHPNSLAIVTSPSMRQCKQWIDEFARLLRNAHPILQKFIQTYGTKVVINNSPLWQIRTATATRSENLQGIHEKHLTFVADEASGVGRAIIETIQGTLSNPDSLFIQIGNPNTTDCAFYDCFTTFADLWWNLHWNAEDTARDYPHIVSPQRNRLIALEYGLDSDVYRVRVKGDFPTQNPRSVMSLTDIIACTRTSMLACSQIFSVIPAANAIGLDFARFGGDESVVAARSGLAVVDWEVMVKQEPRTAVDYAFRVQADNGWSNDRCWYVPDAGGIGQGVIGSFYDASKNLIEFHTQGRPNDPDMFANMYSEAWWYLRNLVVEHIVHLPNDARLVKQLSTREYYMNSDGKIVVESKDEWRKRTETDESPDRADAVVMAFYPYLGVPGEVVGRPNSLHLVGSSARS